jgi:putative mRNA 3-end processing factor
MVDWLSVTPHGLACIPGDFMIDPMRPCDRAVITHGHADHARSGHQAVLATPGTLAIMKTRYGEQCAQRYESLEYGESVTINGVRLRFIPAGHVLGSAQAVMEYQGERVIVTGDYKRREDPTCEPYELMECDTFISEATFGLPVFTHPPIEQELGKLLDSMRQFPERCHLLGAYALGKCQRVIASLRQIGYDEPIYLHGAMVKLVELYQHLGVALGDVRPVAHVPPEELRGKIVMAPPSALADRWSRRLPDVIPCAASGWMTIRARARQRGVELPLIISDHADWPELTRTLHEVKAKQIWITHGRDDALVRYAQLHGLEAKALHLMGYEDESE